MEVALICLHVSYPISGWLRYYPYKVGWEKNAAVWVVKGWVGMLGICLNYSELPVHGVQRKMISVDIFSCF